MAEALRFNSDKPMMAYFMRSFPRMAEAIARVKEMGAIKYNDGNWRLGNKPDDEYWNSMFRHLNYIFNGEDYDEDTGCLHLAHAVWNMCALLELNYPDLPARDDEIWAERAEHWAEQKRIRETGTPVKAEDMPEFISSPSDADIDPCPDPCDCESYPGCNEWQRCPGVRTFNEAAIPQFNPYENFDPEDQEIATGAMQPEDVARLESICDPGPELPDRIEVTLPEKPGVVFALEGEHLTSFKDLVDKHLRPYMVAQAKSLDKKLCAAMVDKIMEEMDQGVRPVGEVMAEMDGGAK